MIRVQSQFLKYLVPYYRSALQAQQEHLFFDKVIILWYDRFPEDNLLEEPDPDFREYHIGLRKKVKYEIAFREISIDNSTVDDATVPQMDHVVSAA